MIITAGSTDVSLPIYFVDDDGGTAPGEPTTGLLFSDIETGGSASYQRQGAARVDLTLITLASASAAHADGGFILIDDTNMPGTYRVDYPDAAFATGADFVIIQMVAAGANNTLMRPLSVDLTVVDLREANGRVDVGAWLGGAIPAQGITGVPEVDVTHFVATLVPTPAITGVPDVNTTHWLDGLIPAQSITGVPEVDQTHYLGAVAPALVGSRYDVSVGAMAANVLTAAATADDHINLVWDEILTGATHNVVDSAGRRLRDLQEFGVYELGAIWIDTINGTAGTTTFENGTAFNPVLTLADALTLSAATNLTRFVVTQGSTITFAEAHINEFWFGEGWTLVLDGQNIAGITIRNARVSGISSGVPDELRDCNISSATFAGGDFIECSLDGTIITSGAASYDFVKCYHGGPATIDFGVAVLNTTVHIHSFEGPLTIANMGQAGTDVLHFDSAGSHLTLAASCIGGTANLNGTFRFTDNSSGMTLNDQGAIINVIGVPVGADISADIAATATPVDVNAQVLDVLNVDTFALPGQVAPPLAPTLVETLTWLYKVFRNETDQTATLWQLKADDGATVDARAVVSDVAGTATKEKVGSGP